ncbi:MAG TPA: hypothetical protein QGH10_11775, partial [Armatimonadota bacterium]|nr:hypothetical protein [Armatimonadota bacterium]
MKHLLPCLSILLASVASGQSPTAGVMITFEQGVLAPNETCDGTISVSDGEVLALTGVLLDQDDRVEGNTWTVRAPGTLQEPGGRGVVRVLKRSKAVIANISSSPAASVTIECALGTETVALSELVGGESGALENGIGALENGVGALENGIHGPEAGSGEGFSLFGGKISLRRAPAAEMLTTTETEDDYPSIAVTESGETWVAWQAYDGTNDVIMARQKTNDGWEDAEEITPRGDFHRPRVAAVGDSVWVIWAGNDAGNWELVARK